MHEQHCDDSVMADPQLSARPPRADAARFAYKAFLSYSHAADGQLAAFLQTALQSFAKPWYHRRSIRVFRDTTGLELTPDLWTSIRKALEASEYFILLASERAAQSPWIELELDTWLRSAGADRLLIVWTDGDLVWDSVRRDFDWQRTTCLHPRLRGVFAAEPLHVDLRWARGSGDLSLRRPEMVDAVARISATLRQLPLDDLLGEDVRQHRRTRRIAGAAVTTLSVLLVTAATAAWFAFEQRNAARRSLVNLTVTNGMNAVDGQDLSAATLWFAEALRLGSGQRSEQELQRIRLHTTLLAHPALQHVWFTDPTLAHRGAAFARDGRYIVSFSRPTEFDSTGGRWTLKPIEGEGPRVWDTQSGRELPLRLPARAGERILAVDATSDEVRVATAGDDAIVRLVAPVSGQETMRFDPDGDVADVEFSSDGRIVLTESRGGTMRIWDAADGRLLETIRHDGPLWYAGLTADRSALFAAAGEGAAHVWRLDPSGKVRDHTSLEHEDPVEQIDVAKDASHMVTVASRTARLWALSTDQPPSLVRSWPGVNHAEFSPNGAMLLMADAFGEATIFGLELAEPFVVVRHNGPVLHASFSPDGTRFATAATDRIARVWDASAGAPISPVLHHEETVTAVSFDGRSRLATTTTDGIVRVWQLDRRPPPIVHESVQHVEFHPDGRRLLTASDRDIRVWDLGGSPLITIPLRSQMYHAAFSPDGRHIVSASEDGQARFWNVDSGTEVFAFTHERRVKHASFRPDGSWLATAGAAGMTHAEVSVWDLATREKLFSLPHEPQQPDRAVFSPDGTKLLTSGMGTASIWDVSSRRRLDRFHFDDDVTTASFSPDGRLVAAVIGRSTVKVYDVEAGAQVGVPIRHENYLLDHVAFGTDSTTLLVTGGGYLRVWDVRRGMALTAPLTHGAVTDVSYGVSSPDGQFLATAAATDGTARVWHASTGQAVTPPLPHGSGLRQVAFTLDGLRLLSAGGDTVRVWSLSGGPREDPRIALHARVLAARQIDPTGAVVPLDRDQFRQAWEAHRATRE
jgi:WD40 repeat protein